MNPRYAKPPGCAHCVLEHAGFGFVPPAGPANARLTFIGESAGFHEAVAGEPFVGAAGGTLSRVLTRAGIDRRQVRIANVVSCRPPGDHLVDTGYEAMAINQCRQYLQPVLHAVPDDSVVIPLGSTALDAVLNLRGVAGIQVKDFHGCVERDPSNRYWIVPTFHPSHLQRGAMNLLEVVTQDLQLAAKVAAHGFTKTPTELVVDPSPDWLARWVADHLARTAADPESTHLAVDTEFAEKAGGADESEVVLDPSRRSPLTRINGANSAALGWTVPAREPYLGLCRQLLEGVSNERGWIWMWNKYADLDHLWALGWSIANEIVIDAMWLWHYLQSDLPRGLGFVAPMASDFGAWKHWGKIAAREGEYAAADGVQTWRVAMWLLRAAQRERIWDLFLSDWHERDVYVLRPAYVQGTPANRQALETFHAELQVKLQSVLERIKTTAAEGVLKPKGGYSRRPMVKCAECGGTGEIIDLDSDEMETHNCPTCLGTKRMPQSTPPASILGKPKKGGGEAKSEYMKEGVRLVSREVTTTIRICRQCGGEDVGVRHKCPLPKVGKRTKGAPVVDRVRPVSDVVDVTRPTVRWFWQLPFNPDAPQQVLAYLAARGIDAPIDKKKQRATTNKKALADLQKKHRDDPFFQLQLDWKAVAKVDSTYAVGALARLDGDDRLHPEFLPKPSTFRDSCVGINLQNVVADKSGPDGLASGFRKCIEARDGVPNNRTAAELDQWSTRWPAIT